MPTELTARLKRALTENIHLKILSLFIAIVLWAIVSGERNAEWSYLVPLEVVNNPPELIITNNIPNFLDLRLQGSQSFIKGLNPKDMAVQLDLSRLEAGSNIFPITAENVKVPRGAAVSRINPSYITIEAEKVVKKTVKLSANIQGEPAINHHIESVEVVPSSVEIMGGESEAKPLNSLRTAAVNIDGAKSDVRKEVPIDTLGRKIIPARKEPVIVLVEIRENTKRLELRNVAVGVINAGQGTSVSPARVNLGIEGPISIIESLKERGVKATVDAGGLEPGKHKAKINVALPRDTTLLYSIPKSVTLSVSGK